MLDECSDRTWIGLFGVTGSPHDVHLRGCPGAYVTIFAVADDEKQFVQRVTKSLTDIELELDEMIWSELLKERLDRYNIDDYLLKLAGEACQTGEVKLGVFHAWEAKE